MIETTSLNSNKVYEKDGFVIQRKYVNQILSNNIGGKKYFLQIMLVLKRFDATKVFYYDIDPRYAPNYYDIVKSPMNFAIIRKNIQDDKYTTLDSFFTDIVLMFKNARLYNEADTPYYKFADEMERYSSFLKKLIQEGIERKLSAQKAVRSVRPPSNKEETAYQKIERKIQELDAISKNTPFEFPLHKYPKITNIDAPDANKAVTQPNKDKKEALFDDLADDKLYSDLEWAVMLNKTRSTKTYKCGKDCGCKSSNVDDCVCVQFGLNCKSGCLCYLACNNNTSHFRNKNTFDFNHDETTPSKVLNIDLIDLVGIDELGRSTFTKILFDKIKQTEIIKHYNTVDEIKVYILTLLNYCIKEINEKIIEQYRIHKAPKNQGLNTTDTGHSSTSNDSNNSNSSHKENIQTVQKQNIIEKLCYSNINFKDHLFDYNMAQYKLNISEELKHFILNNSKDTKFNTFIEQFYSGIKSMEKLNHSIYQIHLYSKGLSPINLTNIYKKGEVVILLGGEVLSPFHFVERQNTMAALHRYLQFTTHNFYSFNIERHWDDPTGYDSLYCTIPTLNKLNEITTTGNDSKVIMQLLSHSCDPNLTINMFLINRQYYPVLTAIKDIDPGSELTLDYRSIVGFFGGNKKRVCLCSSLNCLCLLFDYINYSVKNMENLFKSNSMSEIDLLLNNASLLFKSIKQLQTDTENDINNKSKEFLNSLGIKNCILDLSPDWLQLFIYNVLKKTEDMSQEQLQKEHTFINSNKNLFPRSSIRQHHKLTKSELMVSKIQKLAMLADFVKHFIIRKVHLNDKPPLTILTDKEVINKFFLSEDSLVNEAKKSIKLVMNKYLNLKEEQPKIETNLNSEDIKSYTTLLKTVHRALSTKPTSFVGNGQEEAINLLNKVLVKVKDYIKEQGVEIFNNCCVNLFNLKTLLQIMFLWFNTSNFFYLNKYSSVMQRSLEVEEIIAKEDLEEIEKNDESAKVEFNKHCSTDRKYSPYYPWLCCLYWEFPFIKKSNTSLNQQKVFSYILPGMENCKKNKELKMVKELKELNLNAFYQNNNFEYKYKTKSIYGTPWLDCFITGNKDKYEGIIKELEEMFIIDTGAHTNNIKNNDK